MTKQCDSHKKRKSSYAAIAMPPRTIKGTISSDTIITSKKSFGVKGWYYNLGDSDIIECKTGRDTVRAGDGNDTIDGGWGDDLIYGDNGNDSIDGWLDNDWLEGGSGDDTIVGNLGSDVVYGGTGNDRIDGGWGRDSIRGGWGNDRIEGGLDDDNLSGGSGADFINGGWGNDVIYGDENETAGNDTLVGGWGWDTFVYLKMEPYTKDRILDFDPYSDSIDLSQIIPGTFKFFGFIPQPLLALFTSWSASTNCVYYTSSNGATLVNVHVVNQADMVISLDGDQPLTEDNFIL